MSHSDGWDPAGVAASPSFAEPPMHTAEADYHAFSVNLARVQSVPSDRLPDDIGDRGSDTPGRLKGN
jgi:hypothetical protein